MNCKEYYEEFLRQKNLKMSKISKGSIISGSFLEELENNKNFSQISKPKIVRNISDCRSFYDIYSKCKDDRYKNNCYHLLETYNDCLKQSK